MGSGGVAIAALPTVICLKVSFSDGLGGIISFIIPWIENTLRKLIHTAILIVV